MRKTIDYTEEVGIYSNNITYDILDSFITNINNDERPLQIEYPMFYILIPRSYVPINWGVYMLHHFIIHDIHDTAIGYLETAYPGLKLVVKKYFL